MELSASVDKGRITRPEKENNIYRVIQKDCHKKFVSDGPKNFKKCNNSIMFRELLKGGFGILMFQKCQVCGILPFEAFAI